MILRLELSYYEGAQDAAMDEVLRLEEALDLPEGTLRKWRGRLRQWEMLIEQLRADGYTGKE